MTDRPKKPFDEAVKNIQPQSEPEKPVKIRDKDNVGPAPKPPSFGSVNRNNAAPRGAVGIKRDLPTPDHQKAKEEFTLTGPGDLTREFKPIARSKSKDHGRER